jgi:XTP/dITP diphosphohydrolase
MVDGKINGRISREIRGAGGFGYDPLFFVPELNKTFAELTAEEKNKISHRARALQKAKEIIKGLVGA